jgi:hypothetical protein
MAASENVNDDSPNLLSVQEGPAMVSNQRYFERRAAEEASRASRAVGAGAKLWHQELAEKFSRLAETQ